MIISKAMKAVLFKGSIMWAKLSGLSRHLTDFFWYPETLQTHTGFKPFEFSFQIQLFFTTVSEPPISHQQHKLILSHGAKVQDCFKSKETFHWCLLEQSLWHVYTYYLRCDENRTWWPFKNRVSTVKRESPPLAPLPLAQLQHLHQQVNRGSGSPRH